MTFRRSSAWLPGTKTFTPSVACANARTEAISATIAPTSCSGGRKGEGARFGADRYQPRRARSAAHRRNDDRTAERIAKAVGRRCVLLPAPGQGNGGRPLDAVAVGQARAAMREAWSTRPIEDRGHAIGPSGPCVARRST